MKNEKHIGRLVRCIDQSIKNELNKQLEQYGITAIQLDVLCYIIKEKKNKQDVFQKDIEEHFELTNPTVTGIVKRLECKEMIKRVQSEKDARYKCLSLTEKGMEVVSNSLHIGINIIEGKLKNGLTSQEVELLETLLIRVLNNMKE